MYKKSGLSLLESGLSLQKSGLSPHKFILTVNFTIGLKVFKFLTNQTNLRSC